ncbi:hypothetical protein [Paenibacillus polymyxa]|uniref:hypothetical protein n=1 Tax=Paenibacillus polymyxa TaxID=1406 RepID=UPI00129B9D37|nr:hypothetical protein [Paenibacillus polymyxa]KAE8558030.1 hypothetical protein BJH92_22470 [Paenibacillus polymyxa]MCJ1218452.1 hypothetical protein [Paenibacillus polymyxa]
MSTSSYIGTSSPKGVSFETLLTEMEFGDRNASNEGFISPPKPVKETIRELKIESTNLHNSEIQSFNFMDLSTMGSTGVGTVKVKTDSGIMEVTLISVEEELRRAKATMKKEFIAYKYYSSVGWIFAMASAVFLACGVSGVLGPFSTLIGTVFSLAGCVGAILDWKGWKKKNA